MAHDTYQSPLASRYASDYMLRLFSDDSRYQTWRRLWTALARAQHQLGLPITAEQVAELEAHITDIDYDVAAAREREVRHDVMAHVYAYGKAAPSAAGILHLGATSCYVTDNADLILYRDGLKYLRGQLLAVLAIALNLRTLEKNGKQLSEGDLSTPVDTKRLFGAFRRYGQAMNRLQSGMESAVQEQMRAERMKTELITNVSHDIKTPLTSIVNYVDLLKKEDIPSPAAQQYIAVLDRQSKRLKKLTEDLVEASKASSGALPVDVQPIDVSVLFSQIAGEYQDRLADCHLTLVTQPPEGQPVVAADSKLLSRVMDNLVSNICKYAMPETRVYVSGVVSDGQMTLSFKNVSRAELNISPDELMERFVRGDTSRHTEGSGLGLSIVRSLVQLMGGTFRLSIDADLFRADVTLPLVQQD